MYKILGLKECIKNVALLSKPFLANCTDSNSLKNAYKTFLRNSQPRIPIYSEEISFLHQSKDVEFLLKVFEEKSFLDDFENIFDLTLEEQSKIVIDKVKSSFEEIKGIDDSFYRLVKLVINVIFTAPSRLAGGGSTSAAIGCIWVNIRDHWQAQDIYEFLIHETTHNLVFLDELCNRHYKDYSKLVKNENFAWSAILNKLRPLDKVFHSIIVCTEILCFREKSLGHPENPALHPPSGLLISQAMYSIDYIHEHSHLSDLLTERAILLLDICKKTLKALDCNQKVVCGG